MLNAGASARGLVSFPGGLLQDQLVEREIRDRLPEPLVLDLQVLHAPNLVALQAAVLLAPAVVGDLRHADRADRVANALALRDQHIHLPQLGDHIH